MGILYAAHRVEMAAATRHNLAELGRRLEAP